MNLRPTFHIFLFLIFLMAIAPETKAQIENDTGFIVRVGEYAPDVTLNLINGETLKLKNLKGKVVVLQFTASWCSVCRKEMPYLENEVWLPNKDKAFLLIGVDYDEPTETVASFQSQMKITYPMAVDPHADIFAKFAKKRSGVTRNVLIDKDGKIAYLTRLFDPTEFEGMKTKIAELLAE